MPLGLFDATNLKPKSRPPGRLALALGIGPALLVILVFFGGGLWLGALEALGKGPTGAGRLTLEHFSNVLLDPDFLRALALTLHVAGVSSLLACLLALGAALAFHRLGSRARAVAFIFQAPLAAPHLAVAVAIMFLLSPSGLLSRLGVGLGLFESAAGFPLLVNDPWFIGVIVTYVWKEVPFIALMLMAALAGSEEGLDEAAATLKAGPWQRFLHVTWPTIMPALGAAGLIVFAYAFANFETPLLLGPTWPTPLPVMSYRMWSDIDLARRPEGVALALVTGMITAALMGLAWAVFRPRAGAQGDESP